MAKNILLKTRITATLVFTFISVTSFAQNSSGSDSTSQIIEAMAENSWKALPNTMMKDICPTPYTSNRCETVISAWSGAAFDEKRNRIIIYGGGHGDSWYNNLFSFDLSTLKWSRLTEMPPDVNGKTYPPHWYDIRPETSGFMPKSTMTITPDLMKGNYLDPTKCFIEPIVSQLDFQQPRSAHTYGQLFIDIKGDRFCSVASSYWPGAQTTSQIVPCFSFKTGLWSRAADRPLKVGANRGNTAVDAQGNIWSVPGAGNIGQYNSTSNKWSSYGYVNSEAIGAMDIDRKRNHLCTAQHDYSAPVSTQYKLRRWDLNDTVSLKQSKAYTDFATSGDIPTVGDVGGQPGFVYADVYDKFFLWGGGNHVYSLDPVTMVWTRFTATGDNPGPQQRNGTYGRFRYSAKYNVFILVNSTTANVYLYKPALAVQPAATHRFTNGSAITVDPNPVKNVLNISGMVKESIISIYDIKGKLMIQNYSTDEMMQVNTDHLPAGLYVIRISNHEKAVVRKFIKE